MNIIHIDPGYGKGIDGATYVENEAYNSYNGVAFTKPGGDVTLPVSSSVLALSSLVSTQRAVTLRFSVYLNLNAGAVFTAGFKSSATYLNVDSSYNGFHDIALTKYASYVRTYDWVINTIVNEKRTLNHYSIKDIDGNSSTFDSQSINSTGQITDSKLASVFGNALYFTFPAASEGECYVSNVIVTIGVFASEVLSSGSLLAPLTLSTPPEGDFSSVGGGEYVGNASGQKLLQTIDTTDAVAKFGAASKVSHLVVYGNPGYRVGSNITEAYGISKDGNSSITSHGSCELSTGTDATAIVAWETPDTKLSDLDGLKVGWQI